MAKLWTYITIMLGLTMLLTAAGIDTGVGWVLNFFGLGGFSASASSSWLVAIGVLLTIAGGASAIVIGFFTKVSFEYIFLATFAAGNLITFIGVFISVINYANGFPGWIYIPIWMIFGVLAAGYSLAAMDWVFNRGGT